MIDFGAQPPSRPQVGSPQALSVSDLTRAIKTQLEGGFASIWVAGEVSNLSRPTSGHLYFSLKDAKASIKAAFFRGFNLRAKFDLRDGVEILARGTVSVFEPRGDYQLIIEEVLQKGVGAQELALQELRKKLFGKGYFDPKRKRKLPRFPRRIALVTSPTGAAVRDMLEILGRRWPRAEVWVCPVRVQGEGAGQSISNALRCLNRVKPSADVIIVGRGGGSSEDLWAFNEEIVADAIFESRIPVVSAIGHEIDLTIADSVADKRALTPSEAAEVVTPNRAEMVEQLLGVHAQLRNLLLGRLEQARRRLKELAQRRVFRLPFDGLQQTARKLDDWELRLKRGLRQRVVSGRQSLQGFLARLEAARPDPSGLRERLENLDGRLRRAWRQKRQRGQDQLAALAARLESVSPLNVLARGYSVTRIPATGAVLRAADQVQTGAVIETLLERGRVVSRVETVEVDRAS